MDGLKHVPVMESASWGRPFLSGEFVFGTHVLREPYIGCRLSGGIDLGKLAVAAIRRGAVDPHWEVRSMRQISHVVTDVKWIA